jgi:hypothetical protein
VGQPRRADFEATPPGKKVCGIYRGIYREIVAFGQHKTSATAMVITSRRLVNTTLYARFTTFTVLLVVALSILLDGLVRAL